MTRRGGGWGFAIDYDREIAREEADLAVLERMLRAGLYTGGEEMPAATAVVWRILAPEALGLSAVEAAALRFYGDCSGESLDEADRLALDGMRALGLSPYRVGKELDDRLEREWPWYLVKDEATLKLRRSGLKASLARHRRNREKYGRP